MSTGSVVRRSCGRHTDEPKPKRRHQPSSSVTPSVSPSVKQSWNACSCQSSWIAAYPPTPPSPAHPSLSPSLPHRRPQTPSTWTPTGPWGICASSPLQLQSSRLRWRRELRSFPKTCLHTSGLRFAPARLSRHPPEPCHPNRCLCWHPSLTSTPEPWHLNCGPARWVWLWGTSHHIHREKSGLPLTLSGFWAHFPAITMMSWVLL